MNGNRVTQESATAFMKHTTEVSYDTDFRLEREGGCMQKKGIGRPR